jgi:isopropylmalate/homocitrate/citramalate synthase
VKRELNCNVDSILDIADKVFENYSYRIYKNKIVFNINGCKQFSIPTNIKLSDKQLEKSLRKYKATAHNKYVQHERVVKHEGFEIAGQGLMKQLIV